ncbi:MULTISPECIES: hypothetical protein [unclassified Microcoleus]|uniref:hypothetical protein n=1 Tax=unclassified Microcoleus TaxID=2642155 RepID=UPI002FD165C1
MLADPADLLVELSSSLQVFRLAPNLVAPNYYTLTNIATQLSFNLQPLAWE